MLSKIILEGDPQSQNDNKTIEIIKLVMKLILIMKLE